MVDIISWKTVCVCVCVCLGFGREGGHVLLCFARHRGHDLLRSVLGNRLKRQPLQPLFGCADGVASLCSSGTTAARGVRYVRGLCILLLPPATSGYSSAWGGGGGEHRRARRASPPAGREGPPPRQTPAPHRPPPASVMASMAARSCEACGDALHRWVLRWRPLRTQPISSM